MPNRVLIVDQRDALMERLRNDLANRFIVSTASNQNHGEQILGHADLFPVCIFGGLESDPEGIQFCWNYKSPNSTTVFLKLLTKDDLEHAIAAVNELHVFGLLHSRMAANDLQRVVGNAMIEFDRRKAEGVVTQELGKFQPMNLEEDQCLKLITTRQITDTLQLLASHVEFRVGWECMFAARVVLLGSMMLESKKQHKFYSLDPSSDAHQNLLLQSCELAISTISPIPKFTQVVDILKLLSIADGSTREVGPTQVKAILLKASLYWNLLAYRGLSKSSIISDFRRLLPNSCPQLFDAVQQLACPHAQQFTISLAVTGIRPGMVLGEDIRENGRVMIGKGEKLTRKAVEY